MKILSATVGLVVLLAAAGCTPKATFGPGFGDSVRKNMALHIINPEPLVAAEAPALDSVRAARAIERYHSGEVTELEEISTTSGVGN